MMRTPADDQYSESSIEEASVDSETSTTDYDQSESSDDEFTHEAPHDELMDDHQEYIEDEYDNNRETRDLPRMKYRLLTIATLSCLLAMLLISFMLQLMEIYKGDLSTTSDSKKSSPSRTSRILQMLSSGPSNDFKMPHESTRIYTHKSLTSKNYRAGGILSDDMLEQYERDGVLVIRNLIPPKLLDRLDQAGDILIQRENIRKNSKGKQFHLVKNGAIFLGVPPPIETCTINDQCVESSDEIDNTTEILSSFRDLAIYSKLPRVAASLLRLDEVRVGGLENLNLGSKQSRERSRRRNNNQNEDDYIDESVNLRVCRDIFLTKDDDPYACGWHVDDTGFWPSVAEDPGVNAWIALDDMHWPGSASHTADSKEDKIHNVEHMHSPVATFALSLGSHRAPWKHEAYHVTGSTHTQPTEGFQSAADLIQRRTGSGTCNIKTSAPHLYEKLEERKVVYDLKRGDVIFHDRWLFHRTVTVDEYNKMTGGHTEQLNKAKDKIFRRYSIRYSPGTARIPPGYGFELSALHNPNNANSTLDEISERDGPFYPKVWPHIIKKKATDSDYVEEIHGLTELVYDKIPRAEQIQKERKAEINRLLSTRGRH